MSNEPPSDSPDWFPDWAERMKPPADEPPFDSRHECAVSWALQRAHYVGIDATGSDQWDEDVRALAVLAEDARRRRA